MSVLAAAGLSFSYVGAAPVVADFSLELRSDERVALSAPSGTGKTTLCRLLAGYLAPDAGSVSVDGRPACARRGTPNPVQLIGQHPETMLDPYRRLRSSIERGHEDLGELERAFGVEEGWLRRFPHELSGGQLQRCCIVRALAAAPRFIVADEITTMLDAVSQVQVWSSLLEYCRRKDCGLVFVTHSPALQARIATRVVEL